ncbi:3-hydroxyacyl-CoA dehydrogenase family protein [Nocardia harenae]|uniref:3-hydroxyacyl-CoA dehydrogenase family protein n=1 Tax=Nocardia harenae TaxID=358707 RepID=UPI00083742F2|nr:3-hydroxyacyl-CoA dehydrogenase family protein [Nocardia harenae]
MVKTTLVVGAGTMGNGIAQVLAQAEKEVRLVDVTDEALRRGLDAIESSLGRLVKKGRITADESAAARDRIVPSTDLEAAAGGVDYVIESVPEELELKREVMARLDAVAPEHAVFATNTSQFGISAIASATARPDRVIGTHWFNPPPIMKLIEIVRGIGTSAETLATTRELAAACGKETIVCQKENQGFVTSRLILLFNLEAMRIVEEGIASVEDVNKACVLGFNHAMGPLDTLDLGGLDTTLFAAEAMTHHYGDRFRAPQLLRSLVNAGRLGRKSGHGLSDYREGQSS